MKALLCGLVLLLGVSFGAGAAEPVFILVTTETKWNDGAVSPVGYVELVISETTAGYTVISEGKNYVIPKANAKPISGSEAAVALLLERERLQTELVASDRAAVTAARPTQYNGRPLPRNWIDPRQADQNFFNQQFIDELRRIRNSRP
jgi:hypothetical protein